MLISLRPSMYEMGSHVNLGSFLVIGVKRLFSLKMLNSLWGHMSIWGHLWSLEQKITFTKNAINSRMLHSMKIGLIHVDQLETLYVCYGVTCQSGVIWGHWCQKDNFHQKCYNLRSFIA